jgi:tol-pal system protein YbgF
MSLGCVASQGDVNSVYARQTRLEAKMDSLTKQVQSLKGGSQGTGTDVELREQVFQLQQEVSGLKRSYSDLNAKLSKPDFELPVSSEGGSDDVASTGSTSTEEVIYSEAYTELSDGNYEESREKFKMFISKYPKSSKAGDASYWIAESYYREGEFEEAILDYQRFIDTYPSDQRVPLSYLKQGLSLMEMGKNEEAKLFFETLIDKYPQSDEANTAKEKIRELAVTG